MTTNIRLLLCFAALLAVAGCAPASGPNGVQRGISKIVDAQWWPLAERKQTPAPPAAVPVAPAPPRAGVAAEIPPVPAPLAVVAPPPIEMPAAAKKPPARPVVKVMPVKKAGGYAPQDLIGLDGPTVMQLLGEPNLHRREPFAEVWQYSGPSCVLFVYLYTMQSGGQQVAHAETDGKPAAAKHDPAACVNDFAARMGG